MAGTDEGVREVKRLIERLMIRELDNQGLSGANSTAGQTGTTGPAKVEYVEEQAGNPFPRPPAVRYKPGRYFDTRWSTDGRVEEILARLIAEERRKSPSSWKHKYLRELERGYTFAVTMSSYLYDQWKSLEGIASSEACPEDVKKGITKGVNTAEAIFEMAYEEHDRIRIEVLGLGKEDDERLARRSSRRRRAHRRRRAARTHDIT